jgi:hypothetical protein
MNKHVAGMAALAQLQADPAARAAIDAMKGQMLIVLVNRLGGHVEIPVDEIDGTGAFNLSMKLDADKRVFTFVTGKKP